MGDQPSTSQEAAQKKSRRKRGSKGQRNIGPKVKGYSKASASSSTVQQDVPSTEDESSQVAHSLSGSEGGIDSSVPPHTSCGLSFAEPHVCRDSDKFSETTSEATSDVTKETASEESASKPKRRKKTFLSYKKGSSIRKTKAQEEAGSSTNTEITDQESLDTTTTTTGPDSDNEVVDVDESHESLNVDRVENQENLFLSEGDGNSKDSAKLLASNLTLLIPNTDWSADIVQSSIVRLFNLNTSENAAVQKTIYWNCSNAEWGIYIHGVPVRSMKFLALITRPDKRNIGSVADFLYVASKIFGEVALRIDNLSEPCYRSKDCLLLIESKRGICGNCRRDREKFDKQDKRREKGTADSHIPDQNLSFSELKMKKDKYKTLYDIEKRKAEILENKVKELKIKLDEALSDELTAILVKNKDKMTPIQTLFLEITEASFCNRR
ncbi:Cotranscriptional regulator FAM172A-like protein [Frankliniella fusca]|uniref:Cotranscriptional regulator FAM172A-like protein n=1 Tax=Frankliniella fusca TaxID=407009 RepID=A0AAE1H9C1_9NEOP|nr:Cotranscriptional regulator FAM172A-like protein [Frankliniella fusca]